MYLVGAPHSNRDRAEHFLRGSPHEEYVTSAEVYQEILHRYVAINRRSAIDDAFRLLDELTVAVFPVTRSEVETARRLTQELPGLSARDCLHLAVMRAHSVTRALTFDDAFSGLDGVTRLP